MFRTITLVAATALSLAPLALAQDATTARATSVRANDPDMQRAIQFERTKDRDDARQARKERVHPSVTYTNANNADRQAQPANSQKDPGEGQWKKDKN